MTTSKVQDGKIGEMFDSGYRSEPSPAVVENFDDSVRFYHEFITSRKASSVLDVGMGAGGLLLALQNSGVEMVYGIELSHEGVALARRRFEQYGDLGRAEFFEGSFLDYPDREVDVISIHRVIHCHPDYRGIVRRSIEIAPRYILYTLPRDTILSKLFIGSISILSKPVTGFRAYVHPTEDIREMLRKGGYTEIHTSSTRFWETSVFERSDPSH